MQIDEQRCDFVLFDSLKMNLAAVFWINCRGLIQLTGREHCNSQVWTEQELDLLLLLLLVLYIFA